MSQAGPNPYLRTKILTASREELRLMLYDGAIKFCRQGRAALEARKFEESYGCLMRAQKIVLELSTSLDHKQQPELCDKLAALYTYIYRKLVDANVSRAPEGLDEPIRLLEYQRETWQMLMKQLAEERGGEASPAEAPSPGSQQTAISSLSRSA